MARDIIADLWNTASEAPRALEIQQKIEWVKEATSGAIMDTFEGEKLIANNIHPTAKVHPTAKIHPSVDIPERCKIGEGVVIEEGVKLESQVTIWDHSTIEEYVLLANQVTIWDHSTIKERCRIFHKTTVWKGSNIWMHSIVDDSVVIEENVTLWNHVRIQGPETIIGKKSVIWDNVSLTWYNGDDLKTMKIWENCIIKGNPDVARYSYISHTPDHGLRYRRHSERISPPAKLLGKYKIWIKIFPNVIIDEKGEFQGFRRLDEKKEPKSLKKNPRSLERILTSLSDIVFKDIK